MLPHHVRVVWLSEPMRYLPAFLLALLLAGATSVIQTATFVAPQAEAKILINPFLFGEADDPTCDVSVSALSNQTSTANGDSYTWNNVSIGSTTVDSGCVRVIIIGAWCTAPNDTNSRNVTVNGVAATRIYGTNLQITGSFFGYIQVDSGTTANFVFDNGNASFDCERAGMVLWRAELPDGALTQLDTVSDPTDTSGRYDVDNVELVTGGFMICVGYSDVDGAASITHIGGTGTFTEDFDFGVESALRMGGWSMDAVETNATRDNDINMATTTGSGVGLCVSWTQP